MYAETETGDAGAPPKTVDMYECSNCGATVEADSVICPLCGEVFELAASQFDAKEPEPPERRKLEKIVAAALVLLLVGVVAGAVFVTRPASPANPNTTTTTTTTNTTTTIVHGVTEASFSASSTTHDVPMPGTVAAGDLLIVFLATHGTPNIAAPAGWTFFFGWNSWGGPSSKFSMYAKAANGTEGGTTANFQTSTAVKGAAQLYRISNWRNSGVIANDVEVNVTGSTDANPDPPALDPTNWGSEKTLWIAAYGADGDNAATAYPANYGNGTYAESDQSATSASLASAYVIRTSAAEDPAPFTIAASSFWIGCTVAVRLAA